MMEGNFNGVFSGKKVLVTGHTGFKGAWLGLWLSELGADVTGYALPPDEKSALYSVAGLDRRIRSHFGDVRDLDALHRVVSATRPEIVFHLAAQSLVRPSYRDPVETFGSNVMGTVNLLEALRGVDSVRACVVITSDKCYENQAWVWGYREQDSLGGADPYSASKACCEIVTSAYRTSFHASRGISLSSARAGNVIGGGDWAEDRIVPDFMRAVRDGTGMVLRNPHAIRPWQHVLDALAGYLLLAANQMIQPDDFSEAWNFGPAADHQISVRSLIRKVREQWGDSCAADVSEQPAVQDALKETVSLRLDATKSQVALGWRPLLSIDGSVDLTVSWYRSLFSDPDADLESLSINQIREYMERGMQSGPPRGGG